MKTRLERMRVMLSHPKVDQGDGVISAMMSASDESFASLEASAEKGDLQGPGKPWYLRVLGTILGAQEQGQSDQDLRNALNAALNAIEPGYLGIDAVFPEDGLVVYAVAPEETVILYRRGFTTKDDGSITLADKKEEVHLVRKYEPVATSAASGRGDGSNKTPAGEEKNMDAKKNKERVAAIIASGVTCFKAEDTDFMEKFSDERLTALEQNIEKVKAAEAKAAEAEAKAKTDADKVKADAKAAETKAAADKVKADAAKAAAGAKTPEQEEAEFLETHPALNKIVTDATAAEATKKADLVARLKDTVKAGYTEDQLKALSVEELEKLAAVTLKPKPNFEGAGGPREEGSDEEVPAPPNMNALIIARRKEEQKSA